MILISLFNIDKTFESLRSEKRVTIKDDATHEISAEQSSSNKEQVKVFRKELAEKGARLEAVMAEKSQMQNRIKVLEDRGFDGKNKNLETISRYAKYLPSLFLLTLFLFYKG